MKPSIYLAGAINGQTDEEMFGWRREAAARLDDLYTVLDPARRDFRGIESGNEAAIVEPDLVEIASVQVMLVRAHTPSWGTAMELRYAHELAEKPYVISFGAGPRPSPWLVYHSDAIADDLDNAIGEAISEHHEAWLLVNAD